MNYPRRRIISDEQCIVVLDNSPVRNLAYVDELPAWVATFASMSKAGYSFSLADGAFTELLSQYIRESISEADLAMIVAAIETFINPDMPVLLGKMDVMGMIGESDDPTWSEAESVAISQAAWVLLKSPSLMTSEQRVDIPKALQDDRDEWIDFFTRYDAAYAAWLHAEPDGEKSYPLHELQHPVLDKELCNFASYSQSHSPTLAERADLQIRYMWRQWVRSRRIKDGYDPNSSKKRNDGIDFDLYRYLMLPALVVADDKGFHERLAGLRSPQLDWFWRPQELADAWSRGDRPRPLWAVADEGSIA